jgi:hypothetical protein
MIEEMKGVYYKSDNDNSTHYLIELHSSRFEGNQLVKIYSIDINNLSLVGYISNGGVLTSYNHEAEWICEIDLCGKYFFPKFNNDMQLYYCDNKYYNDAIKTDPIASLCDVINYAIEYGLKEANIKPY